MIDLNKTLAFGHSLLRTEVRGKFQYYLIHGQEKQSPNGLFNRFVLEHIAPTYERYFHKIIAQEEAASLEDAKMNAITAFFKALELNPNHFLGELTIRTMANSKIAKEMDCVVIMFRIYSSEWKPFTRAYMNWVIDDFCDASQLQSDDPDFILFANVIYEEEEQAGVFSRLLKCSTSQRIRKAISDFRKIEALPELPPVFKRDIHKWLDRMTEDPEEKGDILDLHFLENKGEMAMSSVEKKLEKIIEDFNKR